MLKQIKPCPNCGEMAGWIETFVVRYQQIYDENGEPDEVGEFEQVDGMSSGRQKKCARCYHPITPLVKEQI
jgi:hypothetical protein